MASSVEKVVFTPTILRIHDGAQLPRLEVRKIAKFGKGVFTLDPVSKGQLVDVSHIIAFTEAEYEIIKPTVLFNYVYEKSDWPEDRKGAALAMGFGSLFNHSRFPSLDHVYDYPNETIEYHALRDIVAGEELKITYGDELWFEDKEEMPAVFEEPR